MLGLRRGVWVQRNFQEGPIVIKQIFQEGQFVAQQNFQEGLIVTEIFSSGGSNFNSPDLKTPCKISES